MDVQILPPGCPLSTTHGETPLLHGAMWNSSKRNDAQPLRNRRIVRAPPGLSRLCATGAAFSLGEMGWQMDGLSTQRTNYPQGVPRPASRAGDRADALLWRPTSSQDYCPRQTCNTF